MIRDVPPPPADEADEIASLFAAMKDDRAPSDLEARLLAGLAAVPVATAAATAVKAGLWHKLGAWLFGNSLGAVVIGAACGGVVCGAITLGSGPSDPPDHTQGALGVATTQPVSQPANAPQPPAAGASTERVLPAATSSSGESPLVPASAPTTTSAHAAASAEVAPAEVGATDVAVTKPEDSPANPAPGATSAIGGGANPSLSDPGVSDELRRELPLVRRISALVESGRCDEARAAIAAYRAEHRSGQLAGEVDVLATHCQGP